jgi:transglutaminase-like putative cysteine protease
MDASKYLQTDKYLGLEDVANGVAGWVYQVDEKEVNGERRLVLTIITTDGNRYLLTLNQVSIQNLIQAYGKDTDYWVNRPILVKREAVKTRRGYVMSKVVTSRLDKDLIEPPK